MARKNFFRGADWLVATALAAVAAVLYGISLAGYNYPGESAHLVALWSSLDVSGFNAYPLARLFASLFPAGNAMAPVAGALSVFLLYAVLRVWIGRLASGEYASDHLAVVSQTGAAVAAVVFMLSPAVRSAATHLEPRLFDVMWMLASFAVLVMATGRGKGLCFVAAIAAGAMAGAGLSDSPLFLAVLPAYAFFASCAAVDAKTGRFAAISVLVLSFAFSFAVFASNMAGDFGELTGFIARTGKAWFEPKCWLLVAAFSTLPAAVAILAGRQSFGGKPFFVQWLSQVALTLTSILAIATPLAPASLMLPYGTLPVATSLFVAIAAGSVAAYWTLSLKAAPSVGSYIPSCVYAVVLLVAISINLFSFDGDAGAFADRAAEKIIKELDGRDWFVTDGTLDDHLRIKAAEKGVKLNLVCLNRDADRAYKEKLAETIEAEKIGADKNAELKLSLDLGVLAFVQDYLASDDEAAKRVVIFGAPDLWYGAGLVAVPEFFFFGSDASREPDWNAWKNEFSELFAVKGGKWGSYGLWKTKNPVEKMRLGLRRHLGLVANDRGVWLQDAKRDEEAFGMYDLVMNEIDADNVCALFNEIEMARAGFPAAKKKLHELESKVKAIVDDKDRRYRLWSLGNYYGYIRNPEIFMRLGFAWARSGRPGDALGQMRRAMDFIPTDSRSSFMNIMAMLYANEDDKKKSRATYEAVLRDDTDNHEALMGLARLSLVDGDSAKALEYLEKATAAVGDDPRYRLEIAMLHLIKGDMAAAKEKIREVTDADRGNMQAWSLLAAVTIQEIDAAKDKAQKDALLKSLEDGILPTMEKQARSNTDFYLQTTRAFVLMQKDGDRRREARDALAVAAKERPDVSATSDMILGLDISLNDKIDAERHAREMLRRNRQAPLANYVMGSLALQRGAYAEAETYLRRAADAEKPVPLAMNDLAEVLRRNGNLSEAELYARKTVEAAPNLYVAWETLASVLLDSGKALDEAENCAKKAIELSRDKDGRESDARMLMTLARVQFARGDSAEAKMTLRRVGARLDELSEYEKSEFERLRKSAR